MKPRSRVSKLYGYGTWTKSKPIINGIHKMLESIKSLNRAPRRRLATDRDVERPDEQWAGTVSANAGLPFRVDNHDRHVPGRGLDQDRPRGDLRSRKREKGTNDGKLEHRSL